MAYQREDIERVRAATNLIELVEAVTTVKRRGRSLKAICPFHQEKTPSMSLDPAQGVYHCFGCGVGGDVFRFVQETQALDFSEAVELLAARAGITLTRDPAAARRRGEREALVEAVRQAVDFYRDRLKQGSDAGSARAYLRGRGYEVDIVDQFQIGYAPETDGWDALVRHLRDRNVGDKLMVDAGLATRARSGRLRDWFHGRVLFPIFDVRGDPVGFGARLLAGDGPKYLNSPETRLYQKAKLLYGLNWAKADITRAGHSVVVEGYTDVIALHEAGMPQAVATCGTALGEEHFDLLRRFADRIVLAFDADQAGAGAALRGDELRVPSDLNLDLRVALMPEGRDPADLVQDGQLGALRKTVDNSVPLVQFRLERELDRFNLREPEARARAVRTVAPVIARLDDALTRGEYARFVARRAGVELASVQVAVADARPHRTPPPHEVPSPPRLSGAERAEREWLRLLIANPVALGAFDVPPAAFTRAEHRRALELLVPAVAALPPGEEVDVASLSADEEVGTMLRTLALDDHPLPNPDELSRRLREWLLDRRIAELRRRLEGIDADADPELYSDSFRELITLEREKRELRGE